MFSSQLLRLKLCFLLWAQIRGNTDNHLLLHITAAAPSDMKDLIPKTPPAPLSQTKRGLVVTGAGAQMIKPSRMSPLCIWRRGSMRFTEDGPSPHGWTSVWKHQTLKAFQGAGRERLVSLAIKHVSSFVRKLPSKLWGVKAAGWDATL